MALVERTYTERALDAVKQAHRIGITSAPTIFLGRTRINGWHYYKVLQSVMEKRGCGCEKRSLRSPLCCGTLVIGLCEAVPFATIGKSRCGQNG